MAEILYCFVCSQAIYSLLWYPGLSIAIQAGDWIKIYDFSIQPYSILTGIAHLALLWGLWQLYINEKVLSWRLTCDPSILNNWHKLKEEVAKQPHNLQPRLDLAYFLFQNDEDYSFKKIAKEILKLHQMTIG